MMEKREEVVMENLGLGLGKVRFHPSHLRLCLLRAFFSRLRREGVPFTRLYTSEVRYLALYLYVLRFFVLLCPMPTCF